jgi:hypothetical protein
VQAHVSLHQAKHYRLRVSRSDQPDLIATPLDTGANCGPNFNVVLGTGQHQPKHVLRCEAGRYDFSKVVVAVGLE